MLSLEYFAAATVPPMFEVFEVYHDTSHPYHQDVIKDISNISDDQVNWFSNFGELRFHAEEKTSAEIRLYTFLELLTNEIDKLRIKYLTEEIIYRPLPYNHPSLEDLVIDPNNLANIENFELSKGGFLRNGEVFSLLPTTQATNSSYWLLEELLDITENELIKIRLDPLIHQPEEKYNPILFKMQVYGKSLDWERIKDLKTVEHTYFIPDSISSREIYKTDIVWTPNNHEIHFTCEEMPQKDMLKYRGSRYFHAIIEKETGTVKHCDGAIRYYTNEEYDLRIPKHIKANETTRVGKRIKVFQIDVPKHKLRFSPISHQTFINLVTSFFVWNYDVLRYFNPLHS